ncbi:hypothetical protein F5B19DRAFT_222124 [Rostrohypoxylon terebratum]|nr:hypothetical protein F5B19DRAFT_222124 [Rostrohypoxylon terebratum]
MYLLYLSGTLATFAHIYVTFPFIPHLPACNDTFTHHLHCTALSSLFPTTARLDDQVYPLQVANSPTQGTNHLFCVTRLGPFLFLSCPFSLAHLSLPLVCLAVHCLIPNKLRICNMRVACIR